MRSNARNQLVLAALLLLGLLALLQQWLTMRRPQSAWLQTDQDFVVTSTGDSGPGSLREAIFAADSAKQRARILLHSAHIVLESPLPPLVNPNGLIIEGDGNVEIDGHQLVSEPILAIDAPNTGITGISIRNAPAQGILVKKSGFRMSKSQFSNCDVGVFAADGATDFVVEETSFETNRIGIELSSYNQGTILRNNRFHAHEDAGIWAVRASQLEIPHDLPMELKGNHFNGDRMSVVLGNMPVRVEGNEFVQAREAALYLIGKGANVRDNRIRNGAAIGIFADGTEDNLIVNNDVNYNRSLAVLIRSSSNDIVQNNRLYNNGYGLAFVLGRPQRPNIAADNTLLSQDFDGIILVGDSPVIRGNHLLSNKSAGLRILDFIPLKGDRVISDPFLEDNTLAGNKQNEPVRGEYRVAITE